MRKGTIWIPQEVDCWEADVSDGHHTFGELYTHIDALTMRLCDLGGCTNVKAKEYQPPSPAMYLVRLYVGDYIIRELPKHLWERLKTSDLGMGRMGGYY